MVHNLGAKIGPDGQLFDTNALTLVDYFIYNLSGPIITGGNSIYSPYGDGNIGVGGQQQGVNLQGKLLNTEWVFYDYANKN
jgi:hypothetical protein